MATSLKLSYSRPSVAFGIMGGLVFFAARLRQIGRALKHRRETVLLASFDDRMLCDIGLSRSDVRDAYAQPLWRDPTDILARRARDRRVNRQGRVQMISPLSSPPLVPERPSLADGALRSESARPS